jgi:hypothetical protein
MDVLKRKNKKLEKRLRNYLGLTKNQTSIFLEAFIRSLKEEMIYRHKVVINGIGTFKLNRTRFGIRVLFKPEKSFSESFEVDTGDNVHEIISK